MDFPIFVIGERPLEWMSLFLYLPLGLILVVQFVILLRNLGTDLPMSVTAMFFWSYAFVFAQGILIWIKFFDPNLNIECRWFWLPPMVAYPLTKLFAYLTYIQRVETVFGEVPAYAYKPWKLVVFKVAAVTSAVATMVGLFLSTYWDARGFCNWRFWAGFMLGGYDILVSAGCVFLFVHPLRDMLRHSMELHQKQASSQVRKDQFNIIFLSTKQTVLTGVTMFSTAFLAGFLGFVLTNFIIISGPVDVLINCWCIFLSFKCHDDSFLKGCTCCFFCVLMAERNTKKQIQRILDAQTMVLAEFRRKKEFRLQLSSDWELTDQSKFSSKDDSRT